MKIAVINTLYSPHVFGGAERSVQFLAEALAQRGHDVTAVSLNPQRRLQQDAVNGVKTYYLETKNLYWPYDKTRKQSLKPLWHAFDSYNPWMAQEVGRILDLEKPDLVHTHNLEGFSVAVWRAIKGRQLPLVHTLRGHYLLCPRADMFRHGHDCQVQCWDCRVYSWPRKSLSKLPNAVVGNSSYILRRHLELGLFRETAIRQVIHNAYDAPQNRDLAPLPNSPSLKLGYIGRIEPRKGIELLLSAAQNLASQPVKFLIAGNGEDHYLSHLKMMFPLNNVHYMGFVKPETFFSRIHFLVVPSLLNDVLPRVVFEAYAHGIPVIGSNRGGIPEMIEKGATGFIFDPDIPDSFEKAIMRFVEQPSLIQEMRPTVLNKAQEFSSESIVGRYMQVYKDILSRNDKHQEV